MTRPLEGADQSNVLRWSPERFFWTVLETSSVRKPGVLPMHLFTDLQDDLPCPVEETHAVCAPVANGRVVVCAAKKRELEDVSSTANRLVPANVPSELDANVDPSLLNLLVGEFEPVASRRARLGQHALAAAFVFLAAILGSVGLLRRAAHDHGLAIQYESQLRAATESKGTQGGTYAIEDLRLLAEAASKSGIHGIDTPADLATLLRAWPTNVPASPQSISIAADAASVTAKIDGDPTPFLTAFHAPPSWKLEQPRVNTVGEVSRINLELRRQNGGTP